MDMILVVTTGGTIDKVYFDAKSEFEVGRSMVGDLLREAHVHAPFETLEVTAQGQPRSHRRRSRSDSPRHRGGAERAASSSRTAPTR